MKCKFWKQCNLYYPDSFTCEHGGGPYCGRWRLLNAKEEVDDYFDRFWEEQELSEEYIVEAVRRAREEIKDVYKALSELRNGEFDIIKNREELERFLKRLKEDSG